MIQLFDIVGQAAAVTQIERALGSSRVPHGLLFAGPDGVGKRTTAMALAATLLCAKPVTLKAGDPRAKELNLPADLPLTQACGRCEDCKTMAAGAHPDFHLIYKELAAFHDDPAVRDRVMQELSIDVIRKFLIEQAGRAPSRNRGRVFVVLDPELMNNAAQNALLKTLEEPPPGVTIILVTERSEELLPTTLSRCRQVQFGPLPRQWVIDRLVVAGVEAGQAKFWAELTGGSIGQALRAARMELYPIKCRIVERLAGMGPAGDPELTDLLAKATEQLAGSAIDEAAKQFKVEMSKTLASRQSIGMILQILASVYQDAMRLASAGEGGRAELVHGDQAGEIAAIAGRFDPTQLAEIIEQLAEYEWLLWRNVNAKVLWDNLVITCASAVPLRL